MAYGSALVDTIQSSTTGTPPQFNDGSGAQIGTLCRAWVTYKGTSTQTILASFNVSSVTYNGAGNYTYNFTTSLADTNYAVVSSQGVTNGSNGWSQNYIGTRNTGNVTVRIGDTSGGGTAADAAYAAVTIFR